MGELSIEKGMQRARTVISIEGLKSVFRSPEAFKAWVAKSGPGDFADFLGSLNYLLRYHLPESSRIERRESDGTISFESVDVRERTKGFRTYSNLRGHTYKQNGETIQTVGHINADPSFIREKMPDIHRKYVDHVLSGDFFAAARLIHNAITLLQPFGDANKRTARACFHATILAGTGDKAFLRNLELTIRNEFVTKAPIRADLARMSSDVLNRHDRHRKDLIRLNTEKSWQGRLVLDIRQVEKDAIWRFDKEALPRDAETIARLAASLGITVESALSVHFELVGAMGMYDGERESTQAVSLAAAEVIQWHKNMSAVSAFMLLNRQDMPAVAVDVAAFIKYLFDNVTDPAVAEVMRDFLRALHSLRDWTLTRTLAEL